MDQQPPAQPEQPVQQPPADQPTGQQPSGPSGQPEVPVQQPQQPVSGPVDQPQPQQPSGPSGQPQQPTEQPSVQQPGVPQEQSQTASVTSPTETTVVEDKENGVITTQSKTQTQDTVKNAQGQTIEERLSVTLQVVKKYLKPKGTVARPAVIPNNEQVVG